MDGYAAPQLHTHAVIFNVTERADGSTRALQERAFFESQQYATAVYQSELTYQLRNLGYEIEAGKSGAPEIKGYSQEYLDASSPRSQQIKEQLEKTGYSGPEAAQIAAHSTRDRKQTLTPEEVLAAHKEMAAISAISRSRSSPPPASEPSSRSDARSNSTQAKEAVTFARESIFEREAVADERAILRDALRRGMGEATYGGSEPSSIDAGGRRLPHQFKERNTALGAASPRLKPSPPNVPTSRMSLKVGMPSSRS